jgi:hypothetical protein
VGHLLNAVLICWCFLNLLTLWNMIVWVRLSVGEKGNAFMWADCPCIAPSLFQIVGCFSICRFTDCAVHPDLHIGDAWLPATTRLATRALATLQWFGWGGWIVPQTVAASTGMWRVVAASQTTLYTP